MQLEGNTILITGGGSGIGRALAESLHARGNRVIIAGRRLTALDEVVAANPGMTAMQLDLQDAAAIAEFAAQIVDRHPALDVVINNAGIMPAENMRGAATDLEQVESTISINLLGPIRLNTALLPHLRKRVQAAIVNVSSGLAFVPRADTPAYCASKAAMHSYTQSLRYQLRETSVQVIELIPPYVQTALQGTQQACDPRAMPLVDFIRESMDLLETQPDAAEICVERVKPQRRAEASGDYDAFFNAMNDRIVKAG